jgi:hypothetical protein
VRGKRPLRPDQTFRTPARCASQQQQRRNSLLRQQIRGHYFPNALANRICKGRLIKAPDFLYFFGCSCASDHHHHRASLVDSGKKRKEIMREERHFVKILLLCASSFFGGNLRQSSAGMFMFGFCKVSLQS